MHFRHLFYSEGMINQNAQQLTAQWEEQKEYDYGCNPTIALSPVDGILVEEHETNFAIAHAYLHLHVGRFNYALKNRADIDEEQPGGENRH